ncbi:MYXO-CTERM sorting domain-containing protein [Sorangium sp. So ce321]|uniref:MYXO-CTERM sorting domain-containing protein n=1 Tax=Sorangium sp. So ce321 TaxID=3133300 RepID=UPI003F5EE2CE
MPIRSRIDPFNSSPKPGASLFPLTWGSPAPRSSIVILWSRALVDIATVSFNSGPGSGSGGAGAGSSGGGGCHMAAGSSAATPAFLLVLAGLFLQRRRRPLKVC